MVKLKIFFLTFEVVKLKFFFLTCQLLNVMTELCSLVSSETLTLLTYFLPSITKFNSFDSLVTTPNPRYCRFIRWLLYFNEWSGTVTNKERKKGAMTAIPVCASKRWTLKSLHSPHLTTPKSASGAYNPFKQRLATLSTEEVKQFVCSGCQSDNSITVHNYIPTSSNAYHSRVEYVMVSPWQS